MVADLEVLILSSPEEMTKAGEMTYVVLERPIALTLSPFIGLSIGLSCNLQANDPRLDQYDQLFREVSNPTGIFRVEEVTFFEARETKGATTKIALRAQERYEPDAHKFRSCIEFLTTFYGFSRSTVP